MTIKTQTTEHGFEYFTIYEVKAVKIEDGSRIVLDRYSTRLAAEKYKKFSEESYKELYSSVYVYEVTVWVN